MQITLTPAEAEGIFFDAMCNGLGEMRYYGVALDYNDDTYREVAERLKVEKPEVGICYEDVLMEMLRSGSTLSLVDLEDDEEVLSTITLKEVHDRVQNTPHRHLMDAINENGDSTTADCIIQTVFLNDVVYG
jgi:hypothetical protein